MLEPVADALASQGLVTEAWDNVEMSMRDLLACARAAVPTDVIAIRCEAGVEAYLHLPQQPEGGCDLGLGEFEGNLAVHSRDNNA